MRLTDDFARLFSTVRPSRRPEGRTPARLASEVAIGAATLAVGGILAYWVKERMQPEAEHAVIESDGAFSLRRYAPMLVVATRAGGDITQALDTGFRQLYGYISGRGGRRGGESGARIAMAVPVTAVPGDYPNRWKIRFTMPRGWFRSTLPEPANGLAVEQEPWRLIAAVRFAGRASDGALMARKRDELLSWVNARGLQLSGQPEFAAYNAPIVPGPARRNEWWVPVTERKSETAAL